MTGKLLNFMGNLARLIGFEPITPGLEGRCQHIKIIFNNQKLTTKFLSNTFSKITLILHAKSLILAFVLDSKFTLYQLNTQL